MSIRPYISYPNATELVDVFQMGTIVAKRYINEPGQVSFGVIDYVPGWFLALHHHTIWELIIIDSSSEGPGYTMFDGRWWVANPGSGVFFPKGYPHAWSSGNKNGFKMLWVYGGAGREVARSWDTDPQSFLPITPEEEEKATAWTPEAALGSE